MAENILDILTKVDRPRFTIDGTSYEMRHPNELSMAEFHVLGKMGVELESFGELIKSDADEALDKMQSVVDELLDMVTPNLRKDVRTKLNPFHVQKILEAFMGLSRIGPKPDEPQPLNKPSPDSPGSTEGAQKAG